ncbi:tRNA lysidine(34) synthetase TilS [Sphingomonas bacterium]|uniref:tRNA lysidine(34) synthetase TilS n=1 Tax=Sphingomonas bacterium TaxID=1895847 RepID=UPI0020C6F04B|nr:tRNA lysidine(34) synthetase TilS [Sphingomonas bacterium]
MAGDAGLIPDPAAIARFRADLEALTGEAPSPGRRLGVAVSGGGDSLALLLLAAAAYPGAVVAATVDHGLRAEAAAEAAMVGAVCSRLRIPHDVLSVPDRVLFAGNLQERARLARYWLLAAWAIGKAERRDAPGHAAWVATAHQQDDVAETFLMRARRGAGVGGLAAMAARRPLVRRLPEPPLLVRPLLDWSRATLAVIAAAAGPGVVSDPSNADPRFDRSRIRALLSASAELPAPRLALAARNLRDAEEALAWVADREWASRHEVVAYEAVLLDSAGLPHELKRRLVRRAIDYILAEHDHDTPWRGAGLERFVRLLDAGRPATLAGVLARPGPRWRFTPAPARRGS